MNIGCQIISPPRASDELVQSCLYTLLFYIRMAEKMPEKDNVIFAHAFGFGNVPIYLDEKLSELCIILDPEWCIWSIRISSPDSNNCREIYSYLFDPVYGENSFWGDLILKHESKGSKDE